MGSPIEMQKKRGLAASRAGKMLAYPYDHQSCFFKDLLLTSS